MVNHVDIAPPFAGLLFGISNTAATLPGFMAPYAIGRLTTNVRFYVISIGGVEEGARVAPPFTPVVSIIFNLHVAFRENWQNNMLTPPHPLSNPESAIAFTIANVLKKKLSLSPKFMIWCEI